MDINHTSLTDLYTALHAAYTEGIGTAESQHAKISMTVASSTGANIYPFLGDDSGIREWMGERVVANMKEHTYAIQNKPFEKTIKVKRDHIEDDQVGVYSPLLKNMGNEAATHPDRLIFGLLRHGHEHTCYDGQYFFDTDHEVGGKSVSNNFAPASDPGTPWYLLCTSRPIRPLIFQMRRDYTLTRLDRVTDENVFMRGEYLYGVDARVNVGFGLWQTAIRSTKPLTGKSYAEARAAMMGFTNDAGEPLGLMPTVLVVAPTGEAAGRQLLTNQLSGGGNTNEWFGTAELLVSPWLV